MAETHFINVHLANVYAAPIKKTENYLTTMAWGDGVEVVEETAEYIKVKMFQFQENSDGSIKHVPAEGYIFPGKKKEVVMLIKDNPVLKVNFVDVQQGDAMLIESPKGKVILIDGGENQLFARYLAARFPGTSAKKPKEIDCLLVTHGDTDHFTGLMEIQKSEKNPKSWKRLFILPRRVYHNGLVKRPGTINKKKVAETDMFGETALRDDNLFVTELEENVIQVKDEYMNKFFLMWKNVLKEYNTRLKKRKKTGIEFKRISFSRKDDSLFDFFNTVEYNIEILGPLETQLDGKAGLKFLHEPSEDLGHKSPKENKNYSASHTINGHSIVLRLSYKKFSFLLAADLNHEAAKILIDKHEAREINLRSEILKVPHHGSSDFSTGFLQKVSPLVSIVSSGDDKKEFIHPRATLMGALGRFSRITAPLVFVTELVAFFKSEGWSRLYANKASAKRGKFFGFSRTAYGIVKTRTDGNQLLVYTNSGKATLKEAYVYEVDGKGDYVPAKVVKV